MAVIAVQPIILRDCKLTITSEATVYEFEQHVSQVQFDPSSSVQTWKGLTPAAVFSAGTSSTWAATLALAQDWETPNSLSRFLFDHEGEKLDCHFEPASGGAGWDATLIIAPGSIGGAVDAFATSTVTLGVDGRPTPSA